MSGRLVILPKKSYCPWKPENVERVLRDQRLEKERVEKEQFRNRPHHDRLAILRGTTNEQHNLDNHDNTTTTVDESNSHSLLPPHNKHVNLFEQEEEEFLCRTATSDCNTDSNKKQGQQQQRPQYGISPVLLGQSELEARGDNCPFYLRVANNYDMTNGVLPLKEERRKESLDPMKDFVPHSHSSKRTNDDTDGNDSSSSISQPRKKEKTKETSKRVRTDDVQDNRRRQRHQAAARSFDKKTMSIHALRQRRLEREAIESTRSRTAVAEWEDDRKRSYHNQYNPGLCRTMR